MKRIGLVFFELLRAGIWNRTPQLTGELTGEEWELVYTLSRQQAVLGVILDAVSKLPEAYRPPKRLLLQWVMMQNLIEKSNTTVNNVLASVVNGLEDRGLTPYLMKGQGVAQNYPIPMHRTCGDIDLFFTDGGLDDAIAYLKSQGCSIEDIGQYAHVETVYRDVCIELHRKSATFYSKKLARRYETILHEIISVDEAHYVKVEGRDIRVLPPIADAMQLLAHMLRHIMTSGLGIRQVCDWVLFMHKHHGSIDKERFITYLRQTQLIGAYRAISVIAVNYLGMPRELVFCETDDKDKKVAGKMMDVIMRYGNFGHYGDHNLTCNRREYLKAYLWKVRNCMRFYSIASAEAISFPLWQLHSITKVLKQ